MRVEVPSDDPIDENTKEDALVTEELNKELASNSSKWGRFTLVTTGVYTVNAYTGVTKITELPVRQTAFGYAKFLDSLVNSGVIKRYDNLCRSPDYIEFLIYGMASPSVKSLNLRETWKMSNMNIFMDGKVVHFETYEELIDAFMIHNIRFYEARLNRERSVATMDAKRAENTAKFITSVSEKRLNILGTYEEVKANCEREGIDYDSIATISWTSFQKESITKYNNQLDEAKLRLERLNKMNPSEMWLEDLEDVRPYLSV
jgi:hypothetical protein